MFGSHKSLLNITISNHVGLNIYIHIGKISALVPEIFEFEKCAKHDAIGRINDVTYTQANISSSI